MPDTQHIKEWLLNAIHSGVKDKNYVVAKDTGDRFQGSPTPEPQISTCACPVGNQATPSHPWRSHLPWHRSLVPARLGTTDKWDGCGGSGAYLYTHFLPSNLMRIVICLLSLKSLFSLVLGAIYTEASLDKGNPSWGKWLLGWIPIFIFLIRWGD